MRSAHTTPDLWSAIHPIGGGDPTPPPTLRRIVRPILARFAGDQETHANRKAP